MRNSHLLITFVLGVASMVGCGDDGSPAPIDSAGSGSDAAGSDAAMGAKALYDTCTDNPECMSGMCRMFNMPSPGIKVCTQACSGSMPCPMQNGVAVECTNASVCRPPMANP